MNGNMTEATMPAGGTLPGGSKPGKQPLRALIVEDDFACRLFLQKCLSRFGECHIATDGREAVQAFQDSLETNQPYHLVCLDIMLPNLNGQEVLRQMRNQEAELGILSSHGAKIIMTTALGDMKNVMSAYHELCDGYLAKPIQCENLRKTLQELMLI